MWCVVHRRICKELWRKVKQTSVGTFHHLWPCQHLRSCRCKFLIVFTSPYKKKISCRNISKYQLPLKWDEVLCNTPDLHLTYSLPSPTRPTVQGPKHQPTKSAEGSHAVSTPSTLVGMGSFNTNNWCPHLGTRYPFLAYYGAISGKY